MPAQPADDTLRYLRVFMAIAQTRSISRAAERIFKAPSAVTRSLAQLEAQLGSALFERRPRGMLLNSYGEAVYQRSMRIHAEIHSAAQALAREQPASIDPASLTQLLMSGNKLRIFVSLAEQQRISTVCQQLALSKSGVLMSLARLEEAIGQQLFQRMAHGLVATDSAARLLLHARRAFAEIRHIQADLSALHGSLRGTVTVGALPLCRTQLLPAAIARTLARHPGLKIRTCESPFAELAKGLHCGDIDFIFGALRHDDDSAHYTSQPLFRDEVAVFCRAGHPLSKLTPASLEELGDAGWILPRQDSPARQAWQQAYAASGRSAPEPSVETGDLALVRSLLINSDLITACSPHQLHYELRSGQIVPLPLKLGNSRRDIGLTQRQGCPSSPAIEALLQEIRHCCAALTPLQLAA
ncbi:LysR family transcriptional regulator [Vogesella facilis]|uniref:LysR family transcriptional regulator n=1 Tax=Vogesella facilis TaxID=1655232 RepID=A0ABV7RI42_9NEIS